MKQFTSMCIAATALLLVSPAQATITGSGDFFEYLSVSSGLTVGNNSLNDANLRAFDERVFDGYSSHFIAYDPSGQSKISASITFATSIVAVIHSSSGLKNSNATFGNDDVNYADHAYNGLENHGDGTYDSYTVSGDTISIQLRASNPGDYIRVITEDGVSDHHDNSIEAILLGGDALVEGLSLKEMDVTGLSLKEKDVTLIKTPSTSTQLVQATNSEKQGNSPTVLSSEEFPVRIPEPGTLALLGLGLAGIGLRRRRNKS